MHFKNISDKEYIQMLQKANNVKTTSISEAANMDYERKINDQNTILREASMAQSINASKWGQFCNDTKKSLLSECIYGLMEEACFYQNDKQRAETIARNLINNYIEENGINMLLSKFEKQSYVLSEFSRVVQESTKRILEKCDKNNPDTFTIDIEDRDTFFDNLKSNDADQVAMAIKMRVSDALNDFIQAGKQEKDDLENILSKTQEKIDNTSDDSMKESYNMLGKRKMFEHKLKKKAGILESMVYALSKKSFEVESLKETYCKDNKLDMDSIVENCTVMYAFLETLNTAKIENVNGEFIEKVLQEI